jgi:glycosyltransferase involved in cell wall biosynthesis
MELSVVVTTLNGRERLLSCLDALSTHAPGTEVVVVNGPSADGTTGAVRDREDVDALLEVADRNLNVARNAGAAAATGDAVAFLGYDVTVSPEWADAVRAALAGAPVVTGPTHRSLSVGAVAEREPPEAIAGREVTHLNADNVVLARRTLEAADGFDEYLRTGGVRDLAHRLAGRGVEARWVDDATVETAARADGGSRRDWTWKYRSFVYRLLKNYGPRPAVLGRIAGHAGGDAADAVRSLADGEAPPSAVARGVGDTASGLAVGLRDGLLARVRSGAPTRNPNGVSARADRVVECYDWR